MVAIEIATIIGPNKDIQIGSATNPDHVNSLLQKLSNLAEITPVKIIQVLTGKAHKYSKNDLLDMFEESDSIDLNSKDYDRRLSDLAFPQIELHLCYLLFPNAIIILGAVATPQNQGAV